jgi:hypothetical protein
LSATPRSLSSPSDLVLLVIEQGLSEHLGHELSILYQPNDTSYLKVLIPEIRDKMTPGVTSSRPDHRDRSDREQARDYSLSSRTRDRVRGRYSPEQRQQARELASLSCQSYVAIPGMYTVLMVNF